MRGRGPSRSSRPSSGWRRQGPPTGLDSGDGRGKATRHNGWPIAEHVGDRAPDRTQRLLNRAVWDTAVAMALVCRFAVVGLPASGPRA